LQDFILEHYSEDGSHYEDAIAEFMDIRQVSTRQISKSCQMWLFVDVIFNCILKPEVMVFF